MEQILPVKRKQGMYSGEIHCHSWQCVSDCVGDIRGQVRLDHLEGPFADLRLCSFSFQKWELSLNITTYFLKSTTVVSFLVSAIPCLSCIIIINFSLVIAWMILKITSLMQLLHLFVLKLSLKIHRGLHRSRILEINSKQDWFLLIWIFYHL